MDIISDSIFQIITPALAQDIPIGLAEKTGNFFSWALGIGTVLALGILIFAGILYAVSAGNASRQKEAKGWIQASVLGLFILFGSFLILNTVNPNLVNIQDIALFKNIAEKVKFADIPESTPLEIEVREPFDCLEECTAAGIDFGTCTILGFRPCGDTSVPPSSGQYGLSGPVGPQSSITCPSGAVNISPGTNIQNAVNNSGTGTTFCIKAGTHRRQSVRPKSGDTFIGELGAVLDGENVAEYAFRGSALNVTIRNLVIENYVSKSREAAVGLRDQGNAWIVENSEVRNNAEGGVRMNGEWKLLNNNIHHNGRFGITGAGANLLVENNEIAFNSTVYGPSGDSGGTKWVFTNNLILRNNYAHDNFGNALWVDINNKDTLYEGNRVINNEDSGIFHEISCDAIIRNNYVEGNGWGNDNFPDWMGGKLGIEVSNSPNVEVYGNVVVGNKKGIGANQWDHPNRAATVQCTAELKNLNVHDNQVKHIGNGVAGISGGAAHSSSWNNRFVNNTYDVDSSARWRWSGWLTFSEWKNIFPTETQR